MRLAVDAVGEVEGVRAAVSAAAPESQGPETTRRLSFLPRCFIGLLKASVPRGFHFASTFDTSSPNYS
jgi:hypothetical protein